MKIHSGTEGFNARRPVVTIGMFDGLHTGHKVLLDTTIQKAEENDGETVVLTFWPHPRLVLKNEDESLRFLTTLEEKTQLLSRLGIDHLIILPFTKELAKLTAREFAKQVLVDQIGIHHLVIGYNHRFGSDGQHCSFEYDQMARQFGFSATMIPPVKTGDQKTSSTHIRQHLQNGEIIQANHLLGYSYLVTGRVVGGQHLGRSLGYPTANIEVEDPAKLIPLDGVYACQVIVQGNRHKGMVNIGYRPTVSRQKDYRTIEVHIFDFHRDIYSEEIVLEFVDRIRPEMQFANLNELKKQIACDEKNIRVLLDKLL